MPVTNRRTFLTHTVLGGAAASLAARPHAAHAVPLKTLKLWGPPATPSVTLVNAVASGGLERVAETPTFRSWNDFDALRVGLRSGRMVASLVPATLAARLYNEGTPIRLANIMTEGLLYVISVDPAIASIPDLAGRSLAVPLPGEAPEIVFTRLLRHHGIESRDAEISYVATPAAAVEGLLAGRVDAAMVLEPAASAAMARGRETGTNVQRVIDLTEAWGDMTGGPALLPIAGLGVTDDIYTAAPEAIRPLQLALQESVEEIRAYPSAAAATAHETLGVSESVVAASIPYARLVAREPTSLRGVIETMFRSVSSPDFNEIGGTMPDDDFYL